MKRRVQRAHHNKHTLRVVSATHKLSLDHYNILLDASFMRALVMAYMQDEGKLLREAGQERADRPKNTSAAADENNNNNNNNNNKQTPRFTSLMNPFLYMRGLVDEAFGNIDGGNGSGPVRLHDASDGHETGKKVKGAQLHYYYLPESATALHRLIQHQQQAENNKKKFKTSKIEETVRYLIANLRKLHFSPGGSDEPRGQTGPDTREKAALNPKKCNEARTIAAFLNFAAAGENGPSSESENSLNNKNTFLSFKNAHHFFIATQNHDTRRLLTVDAACLRLSLNPNCVYMEVRGQAFHYPEDRLPKHSISSRSDQVDNRPPSESFRRTRGSKNNNNNYNNNNNNNRNVNHLQPTPSHPLTQSFSPSNRRQSSPSDKRQRIGSGNGNVRATEKSLSAADAAFMQHLGLQSSHSKSVPHASKPSAAAETAATFPPTAASPAAKDTNSAHPKKRKRGATANPNPLSNKKKQKREVFRI